MDAVFNRPPAISEDCLQYTLYLAPGARDQASAAALAAVLQAHVDARLPGHIWHRDAFQLKLARDPDASDEEYTLEGRMRVGDCVDDEWCVVWLLREISAKWDMVISVCDSDGEFLLIEAADALPSWVNPTNAENRVWIYASRLHLIPLLHASPPSSKRRRSRYPSARDSDNEDVTGADDEDFISVSDALRLVRDVDVDTEAPTNVQTAVWRRIDRYPEAALQHIHTTKAWLPHDIARALSVDPSLVQKPIETFYTRDAIQLRAAHKMARFPPAPAVLRTVRLTRTAYAQLLGQKFHPPKTFGRWPEREGTDDWRYRDVGMKIACGFEMLYQESKGRTEGLTTSDTLDASAAARKDALRRNPDYAKYIQTLRDVGYFGMEVEGSHIWNEKEDRAAAMFVEARSDDDASRLSFATLVQHAVARSDTSAVVNSQESEDSDAWLNVDADDFDDMLAKTMGTGGASQKPAPTSDAMDVDTVGSAAEDEMADTQAARLRELAQKVSQFVEGKGTVEGATFADEGSDSDDDAGEDGALSDFSDERFSDSDDDSGDDAIDSAERQAAMDRLVAPLGPGEYGQMPPGFHENSQKTVEPEDAEVETQDDGSLVPSGGAASTDVNAKSERANEHPLKVRAPLLARDKFEGVDSDDDSESDIDELGPGAGLADGNGSGDEDEEDRPQLVGDIEVDMGQEEEDFLAFSRNALGISDDQWHAIIRERSARGAFIPSTVDISAAKRAGPVPPAEVPRDNTAAPAPPRKPREPVPGPRPNVNPNLDSFEAVMEAMESELARQRNGRAPAAPPKAGGKQKAAAPRASAAAAPPKTDKGKGKAKAVSFADDAPMDDEDDLVAAMDAELKAALQSGAPDDVESDDEGELGDAGADYNLIRNFLESFKSQGGLSGPVGNLAGRLQGGWTLPRDQAD